MEAKTANDPTVTGEPEMVIQNYGRWFKNNQKKIFRRAIVFMIFAAAPRLVYEFHRLIATQEGAIDLQLRYDEVQRWFSGLPVYTYKATAVYPPASYIMLWPFTGPYSWNLTRWVWALLIPAAAAWLVCLTLSESGSKTSYHRLGLTMFVVAMYPTAITLGNGQLTLFLMPSLLTAFCLLKSDRRGLGQDIIISLLFLFTLVKPSFSVPFVWLIMISGRFFTIAAMIATGYISLTILAASFQPEPLSLLIQQFLANASMVSTEGGYGNIHSWLTAMSAEALAFPISFSILGVLGIWVFLHRKADPWLLMGVTAIVSRLWTYHRLYDDLLILIPLITLWRVALDDSQPGRNRIVAGGLFLFEWLALLVPGTLFRLPFPWSLPFQTGHVFLWISMAGFLAYLTLQKN